MNILLSVLYGIIGILLATLIEERYDVDFNDGFVLGVLWMGIWIAILILFVPK